MGCVGQRIALLSYIYIMTMALWYITYVLGIVVYPGSYNRIHEYVIGMMCIVMVLYMTSNHSRSMCIYICYKMYWTKDQMNLCAIIN